MTTEASCPICNEWRDYCDCDVRCPRCKGLQTSPGPGHWVWCHTCERWLHGRFWTNHEFVPDGTTDHGGSLTG